MVRTPRFDARRQRRRKLRRWWSLLRNALLFAGAIALAWWVTQWQTSEAGWKERDMRFTLCGQRSSSGCVIDGDTIMLGQRKIRLRNFDAPELDGACEAERQLAIKARDALRDWLNAGPFLMDGDAQPPQDRYGRELRSLRRREGDGRTEWLADTMIRAGMARDNGWGAAPKAWCE